MIGQGDLISPPRARAAHAAASVREGGSLTWSLAPPPTCGGCPSLAATLPFFQAGCRRLKMGGGGKGEGGRHGRTPRLFDVAVASTPACAAPGAVCAPPSERAAEYCEFRRDLALGDSGKDVACLQRYLEAEECYEGTARGGDEAAAELAAEALAAAPGGVAPRDARRRGRRSGATGWFPAQHTHSTKRNALRQPTAAGSPAGESNE